MNSFEYGVSEEDKFIIKLYNELILKNNNNQFKIINMNDTNKYNFYDFKIIDNINNVNYILELKSRRMNDTCNYKDLFINQSKLIKSHYYLKSNPTDIIIYIWNFYDKLYYIKFSKELLNNKTVISYNQKVSLISKSDMNTTFINLILDIKSK